MDGIGADIHAEPAYLNGAYLPLGDVRISPLDRGFIFGDAIYEVIPVYRRTPFLLSEHLQRMQRNLEKTAIPAPHTLEEWRSVCERLCQTSRYENQKLYLQITRGVAPRDHGFPLVPPTVFAMSNALTPPPDILVSLGLSAITREDFRWHRCDIKTTSLQANVLIRQAGLDQGVDEVILIRDGRVTEAAASNVLVMHDGILMSPPDGTDLLPGVTRNLVLRLADKAGIKPRLADIDAALLETADEVMITSSTRELLALTSINGRPVGAGIPGPAWRVLRELYQQEIRALCGPLNSRG